MIDNKQIDYCNVSIIIPVYNEEAIIGKILTDMVNNQNLCKAEIIIVNDGSEDETENEITKYTQVRIINHHINKGYGAALKSGIKTASRDFIFWFDGDGQHRVIDLLSVIKSMLNGNYDYCIGVRSSSSHKVKNRVVGKWFLKHVVQFVAGKKIKDFNSGLRGYRKDILKKYYHFIPNGFGASTTMTLLMIERGYRGSEVPITVVERTGKSSVRQIRDGLRTLLLILHIFLLFRPLQFFGSIGLIACLVGLIYGLIIAYNQRLGFPVMGAVAVIFGVQTFFIGLLMDQISSMRRERFE